MALLDLATGELLSDAGGAATLLEPTADAPALAAAASGNAGPIAIRFPAFGDGRGISLARPAPRAARLHRRDQGSGLSDPRPRPVPAALRLRHRRDRRSRAGGDAGRPLSRVTAATIRRATATSCRFAAMPRARRASELDQRLVRIKSLTDRIREIHRRIEGRIAFSTSLGLEDQAILHAIAESGIDEIDVFTLDTGRLFPEVLETVELSELRYGIRIRLVAPEASEVEQLVARDGVFGFRHAIENRKACCEIRKVRPLNRELKGAQGWIAGIRREHSADRARRSACRVGRGACPDQGQSGRRLDLAGADRLHRRQQYPGQSASCPRLRLDRLRAVHPCRAAGRRPARRALVVGA